MGKSFADRKRNLVCFFLGNSTLDRVRFEALATACFRFTPKVAIRFPEAVFLDIRGCEGLFSEEGLVLRLKILGKRFLDSSTFPIRVQFAEDVPTALALARYPVSSVKRELPLEALSDFDCPFKGFEDEKPLFKAEDRLFSKDFQQVLGKLGLRNVGDFMDLPVKSLAARLGKRAVEINARLHGHLGTPWIAFQPQERYLEKVALDEEVQLESVFFILKGVIDRAMARLRGLAQRANRVAIELQVRRFSVIRAEDVVRRWEIELPVPQGSTSGLLGILRERISFDVDQNPFLAPLEQVSFEVLETIPGRGPQLDFFNKKEEEEEKWNSLVGRLIDHLGKENVFIAQPVHRYLPEYSWKKQRWQSQSKMEDRADIPLASRPLRILKKPEAVQIENRFLVFPDGKKVRILGFDGPERIDSEWWRNAEGEENQTRDYYRIVVGEGQIYWVFLSNSQIFLHGYFD
ncbi:MAG: hypothetical protein HYX41_03465 [Bdellovibrio sp.]|nr:hypothetical protein [Bdellovibrio sp.]